MSKKVAIAIGCGLGVMALVALAAVAYKESDTVNTTVNDLIERAKDFADKHED